MRSSSMVLVELFATFALVGCGNTTSGGSPKATQSAPGPLSGDACGALTLSSSFQLAPVTPGQDYVRCDTLGPEAGWQVALSADGRRMAARTAAGTVRILATDSWLEVAQLASSVGRIDAAAFSPDGASLALLSAEMGQVTLWNAEDGALKNTFSGPPASTIDATASSLAFSSDGGRLATSLGTVINLATGATIDWKTGMPVVVNPTVNPQNLGTGGQAIAKLAFSAGDARLFVSATYQIGNSPTSARLSLRTPATGQEVVLFDGYDRGLTGFALSLDGRFVAVSKTPEAEVAGFTSGLTVYRADSGVEVSADASFSGTVLGLSHDGQRLFTLGGSTITVVATSDLHVVAHFAWPDGVTFLGVSPTDELVSSQGGSTSWRDSSTGAIVRTVNHPVSQITWSADGRLAAGTGDASALVHVWRVSDGAELCAPPPRGTDAPPLASLGTTLDGNGTAISEDGSIGVTDEVGLHTHSVDYSALHVRATGDGSLLRLFGAAAPRRQVALSAPAAARLFTQEGAGPNVAVWCR